MSGRSNTIKDLRSKIKHENTNLGSGTATSSFSSARYQVPHVGEAFGHHPGSASIGAGAGASLSPSAYNLPGPGPGGLGAGPSYVSLAPSDSVSNYEADQTPNSPLRPTRSVRRPVQTPEIQRGGLSSINTTSTAQDRARGPPQRPQLQIPPVGSAHRSGAASPSSPARNAPGRDLLAASRLQGGGNHARNPSAQSVGASHLNLNATPPSDRHTRSAQLMAQVARSGTPSSQPDSEDHEDLYGRLSPIDAPSEGDDAGLHSNPNRLSVPGERPQRDPRRFSGAPLGSLTQDSQPAALDSVLSALSSAGRKRQAARIMRGTTAEEESRRRTNEKEISQTSEVRKPIASYVDRSDPRAFQSINAVLRKVEAEWPFVANDHFNSVALALSMLDESSLGASRLEFDQVKQLIETALQGTVDDHYESFATAITMHNSVLQSLTSAQTSVSGARRRLRDSREALGAKRADLVQMWQRSQAVKEALRLLDLVEHLKLVPDRLESLMAEKRFLESVNLLVRSLKTIDKPEVVEVGATNDLRAYLKGQEQAMLEILIEELHNHLYLKSYFCDARWKVYSAGQDELPMVKFGSDYLGVNPSSDAEASLAITTSEDASGSAPSADTLQLTRFLQSLRSRPTFDPNLASDIPESALMTSTKSFSALTGELKGGATLDSDLRTSRTGGRYGADFDANPEADSFLYIEMLLESLSRLGKLGMALDIVSQRLAMEVHQLIDTTIDEVDARNEPLRRFSVALRPESVLLASSSALARSFTESMRSSRSSSNISNRPKSTTAWMLRISAGETSALQRDGETMRDLFWTLFSKLDAVLQGHRAVYEVAGMIASRAGFKDQVTSKKLSGVANLLEMWKPIQQEVRTLLHDYLMDDEGASSARNAVISVNDVLRDHRFGRDRRKQLFNFADAGVKRVVGRREGGPLQRHQLSVTQALKASVPGLVSSNDTAAGLGGTRTAGNQIIVASSTSAAAAASARDTALTTAGSDARGGRGVESYTGAGHRLLVKPDAFNVSVLFAPALSFVERVAAIMPSEAAGETSRGFSGFLEDFVQDIFLPQLEEKVSNLFIGATSHSDSFVQDPASRQLGIAATSRPVVKAASNVIVLIDSLYSMLRTTPFHRESYSRLIVTVMIQFYQKCGERFRDLVSAESSDSETHSGAKSGGAVLSATWAQKPEMVSCLAEIQDSDTSSARKMELLAQETRFELAYAKARGENIGIHELTTSRKKLMALGCLQYSVEWFSANIARLKPVAERRSQTKGGKDGKDLVREKRARARLSVIDVFTFKDVDRDEIGVEAREGSGEDEEELALPLTTDLVEKYPSLAGVYRTLSSSILFTLRLETRLRIIAYLTLAITETTHAVNDTAVEPAPHIVDLNAEIASLDDILTETLPPESRSFVLSGMTTLMDATLIGLVHKIRAVNTEGVTKMLRNILALQQNLKNILPSSKSGIPVETPSFERCRKFYELLYSKTPSELLGNMKKFQSIFRNSKSSTVKAVGFGELQAILQLALGVDNAKNAASDHVGQAQPNAGTLGMGEVSRQKLNEYLIELHEIAGEHESSDDE
uniref:Exocyst complex component Sec8 n=1 Tax=Melanopsichium pennsylvanicum 4 TaxID=1398559 RepID=A0A077R3G3_9BASI|nr:related to SEC8-protein transport protein [Melanopsichium pennsylvanicum 4]